jgi:ABC-type sugar transport system ATPase subunit
VLRVENVSKSFGGVAVLRDVSFDVRPGEVHALAGANGAGKSTLVNIISGVLQPESGAILWDGGAVHLKNPREGRDLGISFVHQELAIVPQLSVGENIFLGRHPRRRGLVAWDQIHSRAGGLLASLGHDLDPSRPAGELGIAEQQLVEIARALAFDARLIIMDEPTAPLSHGETPRLFRAIRELRARGVSTVYITHRLPEIFEIADRVTVLRDGRHVRTSATSAITGEELVRDMIGGAEDAAKTRSAVAQTAREILRVEGFTRPGNFEDITFSVHAGEVLGLAGLVGAGRTELVEAIFGYRTRGAGRIWLDGREIKIANPLEAVRHGLALVPDDRKGKGLVTNAPVAFNLGLTSHNRVLLRSMQLRERAERVVHDVRIRLSSLDQPAATLSGGNQQKVVLGKWLLAGARVYLFDEPTRGIDVGAKAEIHRLIARLAADGAGVVVVSSEVDEILSVADRILVMHRGRITGELSRDNASEARIVELATGGGPDGGRGSTN